MKPFVPFALLAALFMVGEVLVDLMQPALMRTIVDDGILGNGGTSNLNVVISTGAVMLGLTLVGAACGGLNNACAQITSQNTANRVRQACFRAIMSFSLQQTDRFTTGSLITRVSSDITNIQMLVMTSIRGLVRTVMFTVGSVVCMFHINRLFGAVALGACIAMTLCIALCLKRANPLFLTLQERLDAVNDIMQEDLAGLRVIKAYVRELREQARFGRANRQLVAAQVQVLCILAFMNPAVNAVMYVTIGVLLAASFPSAESGISPGDVMAAVAYAAQLLQGVLLMVMLFQNISRGLASWSRVKEVLSTETEDGEGGTFRLAPVPPASAPTAPAHLASSRPKPANPAPAVEFRGVSFRYPGSASLALRDVSFSVMRGETVAVMGATGSGKTTLVSLIPRFYDPAEGAVLVNGRDVRAYPLAALRSEAVAALQKSELFSTTVAENIAWDAAEQDVVLMEEAARIAQAHEFVSAMADGYRSWVAERGMSLSGGQRQRIALARAVYAASNILILDDATSALDVRTEASFYQALRMQRPHLTTIIVAQRIASARQADRIVVLDKGSVAAVGTHDELLRESALYRAICDSQLSGEEASRG